MSRLRRRSSGLALPKRLQTSAYCATNRSVFFSPLPSIVADHGRCAARRVARRRFTHDDRATEVAQVCEGCCRAWVESRHVVQADAPVEPLPRECCQGRFERDEIAVNVRDHPDPPGLVLSVGRRREPPRNQKGRTRMRPALVHRGGKGGIRTLEGELSPLNRLAGGPIRPLWHLPMLHVYWRRGRDSNPRRIAPYPLSRRAHSATLAPPRIDW